MKKLLKYFLIASLILPLLPGQASASESLSQRLSGRILLQVESVGEAWYVYPEDGKRYYLRDGEAAYSLMRFFGLGITTADLDKIPAVSNTSEIKTATSICSNNVLANRVKGTILLQVESVGEAWYVDPTTCNRIYLRDGAAAYDIMRFLGLGITTRDLLAISTGSNELIEQSTPTQSPSETPATDEATEVSTKFEKEANEFLLAINAERSAKGLDPVTLSTKIMQAAQSHADDMTENAYVEFVSPTGKTVLTFLEEANYDAKTVAQNLAHTNVPPSEIVGLWKDANNGTYDNLIAESYDELGIGVGEVNDLEVYVIILAESFDNFFFEQTAKLGSLSEIRTEMLAIINAERAKENLDPIRLNDELNEAAQIHTDDMLERAFYAHDTPEGKAPIVRMIDAGYKGKSVAENIAKGQFSVEEVMEDWMNSPNHRRNIMDTDFEEVGIGLSFGNNANGNEILWAQNFGDPRE